MIPLRRILTERQIWVSGVIGAVFHNIGQILACLAVYQTTVVLSYLPALMLSGIITGLFTGLTATYLHRRLAGRSGGTEEYRKRDSRRLSLFHNLAGCAQIFMHTSHAPQMTSRRLPHFSQVPMWWTFLSVAATGAGTKPMPFTTLSHSSLNASPPFAGLTMT